MRKASPLLFRCRPVRALRGLAVVVLALTLLGVERTASATPGDATTTLRDRELPAPTNATNTCASCHSTLTDPKLRAPARDFAASVHRDERVGCVGCHKGDPRDPTVGAHSKAAGFNPHPTHAEVPGICGGCHSDAAFMRRINGRLPVGQLALFNLSLHGRLSAAGDSNAPNCAVCHGKHDILPPASPRSPVNRANVAKLCGGCHGDPEVMSKYGLRTDQYEKWTKSVHGQAFRQGNPNAPTCTGCHGAHSSTPPDASSVARACGRCHEEEMGFFEQSAHSKGFRERGLAQCVACHSNHDVAPASALLVGTTPDSACMKCHSHDEKPRKVAEDIAALLRGARDRAAAARAEVAVASGKGLHVAGSSYALDRVTTAELRVRGVVHTLDPARVEARVDAVYEAAGEVSKLVSTAEQVRRVERRGYYVALALAGLLLATLMLKAIQLRRRRLGGT
jgi:hypothetical protein